MSCDFCDDAGSLFNVGFGRYHGFFDIGYSDTGCGNELGYGTFGCTGSGIFGVGQYSGISFVPGCAVNGYDNGYGISGSIGYGSLGSDYVIGYTLSGFGVGNGDLGTGAFRPSESAW